MFPEFHRCIGSIARSAAATRDSCLSVAGQVSRTSVRGLIVLMAGGALLAGCTKAISDESLTRTAAVDVADRLSRKTGSTILVDARPKAQYDAGHLPSAVNVRLEDVAAGRIAGLEQYPTIIVYGQNPGSASAVGLAKRLLSMGYDGVRFFEGGVDEWRAAGRPLVRTDPAPTESR